MGSQRKSLSADYGPWTAVIGAAEGIGYAFCEALARRGRNVLMVDNNAAALSEAAIRVGALGVETETVFMDAGNGDLWERLSASLSGKEWGLVVYNAAVSPIGRFLDLPVEVARRTVAVNVDGPLEVVHGAGNTLRCRFREHGRRGGIVLLSSISGLRGTPQVSGYAATKAWNLVLAEGVDAESSSEGVDILACVAGATDTPGYRDSLVGNGPPAPVQNPGEVADTALKSLGKRGSVIPGRANRWIARLYFGLIPRRRSPKIMGRFTANLRSRDDVGAPTREPSS